MNRYAGERVRDGRGYHVRGEGRVSVSDGRYGRGWIRVVRGDWLGEGGMEGCDCRRGRGRSGE